MRDTRRYHAFDVGLDGLPGFAFFGWTIREEGAKVAWGDRRENIAFSYGVVVFDNWAVFNTTMCYIEEGGPYYLQSQCALLLEIETNPCVGQNRLDQR